MKESCTYAAMKFVLSFQTSESVFSLFVELYAGRYDIMGLGKQVNR